MKTRSGAGNISNREKKRPPCKLEGNYEELPLRGPSLLRSAVGFRKKPARQAWIIFRKPSPPALRSVP
jgi:hypothetical protein